MKLKIYILALCMLTLAKLNAQVVTVSDTAFKACLVKKLPSFLDESQNLIIDSARNYKGTLNCNGFGIVDADLISYFDSVDFINLSRNNISSITAFPNNSVLTRIILDDNQLTSLPSIDALTNLRTLQVKRNQLTSLPNLSENTLLSQLYVEDNKINALPALDKLSNLWAINVSKNELSDVPNLDNNINLVELVVTKNKLTSLPSLMYLPKLNLLDASHNELTELPLVNDTNQIEEIYIAENKFDELPDFSLFSNLNIVDLNDNNFTFAELEKLIAITNYESIFSLTSQRNIDLGYSTTVRKLRTKYISANIDTSLTSVNYQWYFEGQAITSAASKSVKLLSESVDLSGDYYYEITHPAFPNLVLRSNIYRVSVLPCFETEDLKIEITDRTCKNNGGEIQVSTSSSLPSGFRFVLESATTSNAFSSKSGSFANLGDTEYILKGSVDVCTETIESSVKVADSDCENAFITADEDGVDDEYFLNQTGIATIRDKFGNKVETLELPTSWNATSNGAKVAPGLYYIDINDGSELIKITVVH